MTAACAVDLSLIFELLDLVQMSGDLYRYLHRSTQQLPFHSMSFRGNTLARQCLQPTELPLFGCTMHPQTHVDVSLRNNAVGVRRAGHVQSVSQWRTVSLSFAVFGHCQCDIPWLMFMHSCPDLACWSILHVDLSLDSLFLRHGSS